MDGSPCCALRWGLVWACDGAGTRDADFELRRPDFGGLGDELVFDFALWREKYQKNDDSLCIFQTASN